MSLQTWGVLVFDIKHRKDCEPRVQDEENGSIFQESWHIEYHLRYYVYGSGRAGTIDFFHVVNAESWRLGIGNDHEKKTVGALPMDIAVRTPQMRSYVSTRFRNGLLDSHQLSKFPDLSACPRRTSFYSMSFSTATKISSDSRHLCCSMSPNDLITWISITRMHTKHSNFHNSLVIWWKTKLVREGLQKTWNMKIL
jgi:hypothetical protein